MKSDLIALIGSGPSLTQEDISYLIERSIPTFSFNRSFLIFKEWNFRPTYYGCFDPLPVEDLSTEIEKYVLNETESEIFLNIKGKSYYSDDPRYKFLSLDSELEFTPSTDKISDLGSAGATSTQLAVALGYRKIILIGMDGAYNLTDPRSINHFLPNYLSGIRTNPSFNLSKMDEGWQKAALGCAELKIKVINASRKTAIKHFQVKSLNEAIICLQG